MHHFEKLSSYLPISLLTPNAFMVAFLVVFAFIVFRYFLFVGVFYLFFWKTKLSIKAPLYSLANKEKQIQMEIFYSVLTSLVFAFFGVVTGLLWELGYTQIYLEFNTYPLWYMPLSLILFSLVHEIWFYVTHRWMHRPKIFKIFHKVHHLSKEPSPWASFSFHPLEALVESIILPLMVLIIPIHPTMFILYLTLMTFSAINNHLGIELFKNPGLLISAKHHSDHHRYFNCNYGLYFRFLDIWLKTER